MLQNAALTVVLLLVAACALAGSLFALAKRRGSQPQSHRLALLLDGIGLLMVTIGISQLAMVLQIAGRFTAAVWAAGATCALTIIVGLVLLVVGLSQPPVALDN